ncbi:hypothetical protein [Kibdelosporangium philippinense]|uniref:hypothetical protein n=1 Tax=Kibdelosporangium philippinense TaxID=211113 RepID=UPI00361B03C6
MSPNANANAPKHVEHSVSPGSSRANFLHFSHRVRVTPLADTTGVGSTLSTVYSRWVGSTEAEQVGSQESASVPTGIVVLQQDVRHRHTTRRAY